MNEEFLRKQEEIRKRNEERLAQFENRTERQKLADSARGMLFDLTLQIYTQMNGHNLTAIEHEKQGMEFAREILDMSDELALSIIKNIDITLLRQSWHDRLISLGIYNMYVPDGKYVKAVLDPEKIPKEPQIFEYIELSRVMEEAENSLGETSPVEQAKQMLNGKEIMNKELPKFLEPLEEDFLTREIKNMIIDLSSRSIYDEYKYNKNEEEINNVQSSIKAEIQHLSRDLLKNLIQAFDGKRMMEQRVITNAAHADSNSTRIHDHYSSLFTYLDKMAVKEAENVMKDFEIQNNPELATNLNSQQTSEDEEEIKQEETVDNSLKEALQKEKLARDAWRKNSSSYELYQNYKNSIAERLEIQKEGVTSERSAIDDYEEKKQAYEKESASKELMEQVSPKSKEEIDADLDDFEAEERRILNSKHFTDEQKKKMIEDLYTEFDKYTEQNPEISGRHM